MKISVAVSEQGQFVERNPSERRIVLSAHNLRKAFGGQLVLNDISLNLHQGEVVLLVGDNGSGKTTLLNILTGNIEPDKGEIKIAINGTKESFTFPRSCLKALNPFDHFTPERLAWEGVGKVWQDNRLFQTMTTVDNITVASTNGISENPFRAFSPNTYRINKKNKEDAAKLLDMLGLAGRHDSSCGKISLGQQRRVGIVRAIQAGAKILFLDEPLSGLDEKGITEVIYYLQTLVKDHSITLVIVEHYFNFPKVIGLVDTIWRLSKDIKSQEGYSLSISEPHTLNMESADGHNDLNDLMNKLTGANGKVKFEELSGGARITTSFASDYDKNILEVKNLKVKRGIRSIFESDQDTLSTNHNGLSLTLKKGQIAILEAPNGWGKSTLLDAIAGVHNNSLEITAGNILLKGEDITSLPTHQIVRKGLSYLRANQQVFSSLKIKEQLKLKHSSNLVFNVFLDENSKGSSLSGGEKQKILINLLPDADVYLLDEPMIGLDQEAVSIFLEAISHLILGNKTIILAIPYINRYQTGGIT